MICIKIICKYKNICIICIKKIFALKEYKHKRLEIYLNVYNDNFRAVRFYKREGFKILDQHIDENVNRLELLMSYNN